MNKLFLLITLLSIAISGNSMSIFSAKETILFSPVDGIITYKNEPAGKAIVHRQVKYNDEVYEDSAETTDDGHFSFEPIAKKERYIVRNSFVAHQKIFVEYDGNQFLIWETAKREEEKNSELEGKNLSFKCELTDENRFVHLMLNSIETKCTWSG
ncbi:DUF6795 domain-containing protein [Microbulbifer halophilus]|uniref:DUF6795 domain-containing protein n=1 Tax=Microbulbifer halophilus TaxID=453963 RepID=A0ABW5EHY1_9GAMM|nr:DUF6795 domain-containing protein [Microbulbifer halophilus]MCW8127632.1 hypothetical protein [Microbulbifer halophilus]